MLVYAVTTTFHGPFVTLRTEIVIYCTHGKIENIYFWQLGPKSSSRGLPNASKNIKTFLRLPATMSEHWTKSHWGPFQLIMCPPGGGAGGGLGGVRGGCWANNSINCVNCPIVRADLCWLLVVPVTLSTQIITTNTKISASRSSSSAWSCIVGNIPRDFSE